MAIGAHADDIELNVGGTLCKYKDLGYEIVYVMSTNNMSGNWSKLRPDGTKEVNVLPYDKIMPQRKKEAAAAAEFFGTKAIHLDHPQSRYTEKDCSRVMLCHGGPKADCVTPNTPTILTAHRDKNAVQNLTELILKHQPEAILTHGPIMVDMEHIGTSMLVTKAYKKAVESGFNGILLYWLDITPTIFGAAFTNWDAYIDVSDYWEEKLVAIGIHACQMPDTSHLTFPNWGETCGCNRAEVFNIGKYEKLPQKHSPFYQEISKCQKASEVKPDGNIR